jgi:hypothetical protein
VRSLKLADEEAVIAEVERLRSGGYVRRGKWTLAQIAWHVGRPLLLMQAPPPADDVRRTPEQEAKKKGFVDHIISTGTPPPHVKDAPPGLVPAEDVSEAEIDRFVGALRQMKAYPHARIVMGPIGPVAIDEYRKCNVFHAAHHLSFLEPRESVVRRELAFGDEKSIVEDIRKLKKMGYAKAGTWTLGQVCWHLDLATKGRMLPGPFPPNTAEQDARRSTKEQVLATGKLPAGLPAPEQFLPPAASGDEAIDACIGTLEKFAGFGGPISPHRLFGNLTLDEGRRINRAHCAHHLSYLVPNE